MGRPADTDRVIWLLQEQGRSSNRSVRSALNLTDARYLAIKNELLDDGLIEKVKGQGGGIQLTAKGLGEKTLGEVASSVQREKDLYAPFIKVLVDEALENEDAAVVADTSALRKRGKWSNPDVTKISIQSFPILLHQKVLVTTYEIKQWGGWDVEAIFEAASHRRVAHAAYTVLEWPKGEEVVGLERIISACGEFGVGLMIMRPHYSSYKLETMIEAVENSPSDAAVAEYLGYVFERNAELKNNYKELVSSALRTSVSMDF